MLFRSADGFIRELERIARKQVVITTPNGNFHLDAFDENPHQEHRSQWNPADLRRRGYSVTGHGLLGMGEVISVAPRIARYPLYLAWVIVGPIAKLLPGVSGDLVARRRLRG